MDQNENQQPHQPTNPRNSQSSIPKLKPFHLLSIIVLFLAISFTITKQPRFKTHLLSSSLFPNTKFLLKFLRFTDPFQQFYITGSKMGDSPPHCLLWMAPFLSGGGYSSEAWSYILALHNHLKRKNPRFRLGIEQHGDLENLEFWEGLPLGMRKLAIELHQTECRLNQTILICHSEPGAWYPPLFQTLPCPPSGYGQFKAVIGRTMFETDRVNDDHVNRCNRMDFVWVPTDFHLNSFRQSGVDPVKLVKIVQAVDSGFFDPEKYNPLDLESIRTLVLGSNTNSEQEFVFLSVFKWEYRKGWDVLLKSYLKEFSNSDNVALYLLTNPYHSGKDFNNKITEYIEKSDLNRPVDGWATVYVIDKHIAQVDLPRLYRSADAFVLPSRGEGWGRPVVEAMAMALPVIATNWSGPTEYLTQDNSYPLPVDEMSEVKEAPFKGHFWAEPSVEKLQVLMRNVYAKAKECSEQISVEEFAIELAKHFTFFYQPVTTAIIRIMEMPWERVYIDGQPHEHGFKLGNEKHSTEVIMKKSGGLRIVSGIQGLSLLKTTKSGFEGFIRDNFTILPETRERMMATEVTASWTYALESLSKIPAKPQYFTERYMDVKKVFVDTFFGSPKEGVYSPSVQSTLYYMARAVLERFPDISSVQLKMPNLHFLPVNLSSKDNPVIVKFEDDVYLPTDEPHGSIEASLSRIRSKM